MSEIIYSRGDQVVWLTEKTGQHTTVHRYRGDGETYCSRKIPPDDRIVPFHHRYDVCRVCERMCARADKYFDKELEEAS